jgi:hypothetical protein
MQEEECLGVHCNKYMILEFCYEGAGYSWPGVISCRRPFTLHIYKRLFYKD